MVFGGRTGLVLIHDMGSGWVQGVVTDVTCGSVCDRDQNGIMQVFKFFLGADQGIKTNSEQLISTDQHTFSDT